MPAASVAELVPARQSRHLRSASVEASTRFTHHRPYFEGERSRLPGQRTDSQQRLYRPDALISRQSTKGRATSKRVREGCLENETAGRDMTGRAKRRVNQLTRKVSRLAPFARACASQRGRLPRPVQVSAGLDVLRKRISLTGFNLSR